jgi:hypothetical protein
MLEIELHLEIHYGLGIVDLQSSMAAGRGLSRVSAFDWTSRAQKLWRTLWR